MHAAEIVHVAKSFGKVQAVRDVSFVLDRGEIFGLLGPNGAGKTTSIRMMLDILQPDAGTVSVLGGPMDESKKDRIGYMPEERGLYQDLPLEKVLIYLGSLKGLSEAVAKERAGVLLERFDLADHRTKKVSELSKGMQQKAQIINTILHEPEIIIIDEPFTALDPVNTQLVKGLLKELRDRGAAVLMSTHQMHQVEALCDRILLINEGANLLEGTLDQIRRQFAGHAVQVRIAGELPPLQGVIGSERENGTIRLTLETSTSPQDVLRQLVSNGALVEQFEIAMPTLDEVFIRSVGEGEA